MLGEMRVGTKAESRKQKGTRSRKRRKALAEKNVLVEIGRAETLKS
jgi:hypothetical protein